MRAMKLSVSIQQIESKRSPAHVAQAVEHFLGKEKVPGSNPGVGSSSRHCSHSEQAQGFLVAVSTRETPFW